MSYLSAFGGSIGLRGGFGYEGLGGTYPLRRSDTGTLRLQRELQRLGYMQSGSGVYGADGRFGPITAEALERAAVYVAWTGPAYSPENAPELRSGTVTVPSDLVDRIRAASPDPSARAVGTPDSPSTAAQPGEGRIVIGPHLDPPPGEDDGPEPWIIPVVTAASLLGAGVVVAFAIRKKPVAPNRRRRRRSSRRRK